MSETVPRPGSADPVKALLHRHRSLCERAVDPLEIAAGLEARGITDRGAARFRHRDVFSLAEEVYARAPYGGDRPGAADPDGREPGAARADRTGNGRSGAAARIPGWVPSSLLPGLVCALTAVGLAVTSGPLRAVLGAAGAAALAVTLSRGLRHGPLGTAGRRPAPGARAAVVWLLLYAACGDGLLDRLLAGGPAGTGDPATGPLLGLALALAPTAGCAHLFAVRARRGLAGSRSLRDFAARTRPLLLGVVALHGAVLAGLLMLADAALDAVPHAGGPGAGPYEGALAPALALGVLLFLARLLTVHGFPGAAATGLLAAGAAEALAPAFVLAGRLPGCEALARPVRAVAETWGPGAVPALVCGAAALALLVRAAVLLTRACAHTET